MTKKLVNFTKTLCNYMAPNGDYGDTGDDKSEYEYGILTEYVIEMFAGFDSKYFNVDIHQLKLEIIAAYDLDACFWQALNQDELGRQYDNDYGFSDVAIRNWEEYFSDEFNLFTVRDEFYHIDMLKLLVKVQIWDRIFPNEELPNYQAPQIGQLLHFGDHFTKKLTPWNSAIIIKD
ncbi:hypothetical protein HQQ94_13370 [Shewanella sp. VB17]|uniref:hypothetical protein n=1 Tax=Shewanella sp. VB17 TaxID=2739432 RepID=UPI001567637D|nr:hypothetical protein [Shewanella sp. VB17]NRD74208.1 hypothetical protein [Shewanella sp. VB17]